MKTIKRFLLIILALILFITICNVIVINSSKEKCFSAIANVPTKKVGLLLGASKYLSNGQINLYYKYRLEAAIALYHAEKVKSIIVSGDNSRKEYNEPETFKNDLIAAGIPESCIHLDYAGFRTLDSVYRAHAIFQQESFIVISQEFHNQRAIYLAKQYDLNAVGFNAKEVSKRYGLKTKLREYLAKTKAVLDIIINKKPKYLGKTIDIIPC